MMNDRPPLPDEPDPIVPKDIRARRAVPSLRKAPTVRSGKGSIFGKASIPSVYWAGDDPTPMNHEEFTFYREGTPPPDGEKASVSRSLAYRQSVFDHDDSEPGRRPGCCGLRRGPFWLLIGLIVLIALGVGIGVGVGVGADAGSGKKASQLDENAGTTSPSPTPTATTVPSPTKPLIVPTVTSSSITRSSAPSETASSTVMTTLVTSATGSTTAASPTATSGPNSICPEADNTIYHVIGSDKKFLRLCGVDYSGSDGAIDMFNVAAVSMGECMEACAKAAQCTGVSWGNVMVDGEAQLRCWLKRGLMKPHPAVANWNFAILQ
ncbi:uncharacterized protein LY79DRAFT_591020 [Colletotrichum navitas]|uniref:Apple domain-containing protein n=1 Tax=Colletotrichum navitas TaxID=681940 RepID=A0AAD8PWQ3_9PEZI|nr:uncharacterized protein LY79DRAFT_591020 [Colletotrichum navitas]KAK1586100.1 hypothetical protein LY79DRAFT_591020 [Colletotrichum navitas]